MTLEDVLTDEKTFLVGERGVRPYVRSAIKADIIKTCKNIRKDMYENCKEPYDDLYIRTCIDRSQALMEWANLTEADL